MVLDIMNDKASDHEHLIRNRLDYSVSQIWSLSAPYGGVQVKDHTGYWCLTRFTKHKADQIGDSPEYESDIQLSPCEKY